MASTRRITIISIVLTIVVALGAFVALEMQVPKAEVAFAVGKPAPDFTLKDQDGKDFTLSSQRGHKVLLMFYRGYW